MKLPSLDSLFEKAVVTLRRFPAVLVMALIGTVFSIRAEHVGYDETDIHHWYWNIILSAYVGMLLLIALTIFSERRQWSRRGSALLQLAGIVLTVVYYFFLPDHFAEINMLRFTLFVLALHWLIAFIPFTRSGEMNGFWQYNKILFLRILTSALYTSVLFLGLALALVAIDQLFKVDINDRYYLYLWSFLSGLFNTLFFLAGFPRDYASLEERTDYPKGLKIFTQYVLLPIITVYLLILYAYMGRIIIMAQWPVGWVSHLILGFSVAGVLSLLLIHPVRNEANNRWILAFSKFFYIALFPLLILLFFAISRRIRDYGITESRYFVLLLALWLAFIAIYFLASSAKNIKLIPQSLFVVAVLCSFGPWGAFQVSIASQRHRLDKLFEKNNMLADGKLIRAVKPIPFKDRKSISATIEYLVDTHGYGSLQPFFAISLDSVMRHDRLASYRYAYSYTQVTKILSLMDIEYVNPYQATDNNENNEFNMSANLTSPGKDVLNIDGYQYMIGDLGLASNDTDNKCSSYLLDKKNIRVCLESSTNKLLISGLGDSVLTIALDTMLNSIRAKGDIHLYNQTPGDLHEEVISGGMRLKLMLSGINGSVNGDKLTIHELRGDLFLGKREDLFLDKKSR